MTISEQQITKNLHDFNYRSGVGIMLINNEKKIFVGKRIDNKSDAWQMPQGGIDSGEDEDLAMFRELREETGILRQDVEIVSKSQGHLYYHLPYNLQKKFWGGKYIGQKQKWYLLNFLGDNSKIDINTDSAEFSAWKWIEKHELTSLIVGFKREMYEKLILEFAKFL